MGLNPGQHPQQAVPYDQVDRPLRHTWLREVFHPSRVVEAIPSCLSAPSSNPSDCACGICLPCSSCNLRSPQSWQVAPSTSRVAPLLLDSHDSLAVAARAILSVVTSYRSPDYYSGLNLGYIQAARRPSTGVLFVSLGHAGRTLIQLVSTPPTPSFICS